MEADPTSSFGSLLRRYRILANLSQAALAERAGLSMAAINTLERGVHPTPRMETVRLLAEALGLDAPQRAHFSAAARHLPSQAPAAPEATAPTTATVPPTLSVPTPLAPLVGRTREVAELRGLLGEGTTRLLTLVGSPGVGKTRLGLAVARALLGAFPDGIGWLPLAAVQDPALVVPTIAQAFGLRETPALPLLLQVCRYLRDKHLLLLLDNFEHLVASAPFLADILAQCPQVRVLVTSRTPLHLQGEREYAVAPLAVPGGESTVTSAAIQDIAAVQLFIQRAQAVKPDFALTDDTAPGIAAICRRLDGVPLALELAAARVKMLPIQHLLTRLDHPLSLLTGGPQNVPPHQQTLRSTLAWSYHLLTPATQSSLRHMAVFTGGATLAALAQVLDVAEDVLIERLAELIDQSLVVPHELYGEARFDLLMTIREYGRELLAQHGELAAVQGRHAAYYLARAEAAASQLQGQAQNTWLDHLEANLDEYRAVLTHFQATAASADGLRLCLALGAFWRQRGYLTEGRQWFDTFLAASAAEAALASSPTRAAALVAAGSLAWPQGDYPQAQVLLTEGLVLHQRHGHRPGIADALNALGVVAMYRGDVTEARQYLEESLVLRRALPDPLGLARTLNDLGGVLRDQGEDALARQVLQESLALARQVGNRGAIATLLNNLGGAAVRQREFAEAQRLYAEALALKRELGDARGTALALINLGELAHEQGHYAEAHQFYTDSLILRRQVGDKQGIAANLRELGSLAFATGKHKEALVRLQESLLLSHEVGEKMGVAASLEMLARVVVANSDYDFACTLFAVAAGLRHEHHLPVPPKEKAAIDAVRAALQAHMGDVFEAAVRERAPLPLEGVLAALQHFVVSQ